MIDSDITCLFPAANKHRMFISQCTQQLHSTRFFTAPTVMKSGLHLKSVNLSDKWFVYPVSFDCIAAVGCRRGGGGGIISQLVKVMPFSQLVKLFGRVRQIFINLV